MPIGIQLAASQGFMWPVIRTSVSHWHLRYQFHLHSAFSGIPRVGADCLPEVSSLKMLQLPAPISTAQLGHVLAWRSALRITASSSWVSNASLFHWHWGLCRTLAWDSHSFGSRCPRWKTVEIIFLFCGSQSTPSLCHCLQLQAGWPANHRLSKDTYFWEYYHYPSDQDSDFQSFTNPFSTSGI